MTFHLPHASTKKTRSNSPIATYPHPSSNSKQSSPPSCPSTSPSSASSFNEAQAETTDLPVYSRYDDIITLHNVHGTPQKSKSSFQQIWGTSLRSSAEQASIWGAAAHQNHQAQHNPNLLSGPQECNGTTASFNWTGLVTRAGESQSSRDRREEEMRERGNIWVTGGDRRERGKGLLNAPWN